MGKDVKTFFENRVKEFPAYSPKAVDYNNDGGFSLRMNPIYRAIGDLKNKSVLDIGCGNGGLLTCNYFKPERYFGVDIVPEFVFQVLDLIGNLKINGAVKEASLHDISFEEMKNFDVVVVNGVNSYVEVFKNPDHFYDWFGEAIKFCKKLVITSMSTNAPKKFDGRVYMDPLTVCDIMKANSKRFLYDHSYCEHDFLIVTEN